MKYQSLNIELAGALEAARGYNAIPAKILLAQKRSVGTLRRRLPAEAKRDIGSEYNLSAARIAAGLRVRNTDDGLVLSGSARGVNAQQFNARWQSRWKTGARFNFRRDGVRGAKSAHPGSFIGTGINSARLVFERDVNRGKHLVTGGHNTGQMKQYINSVYGPSIGQMLKHGRRPERLAEFARRVLSDDLTRQLR